MTDKPELATGKRYHTKDGRIAEIVDIHSGDAPPEHVHAGNAADFSGERAQVPHIIMSRLIEDGVEHDPHPMHVDKFHDWIEREADGAARPFGMTDQECEERGVDLGGAGATQPPR